MYRSLKRLRVPTAFVLLAASGSLLYADCIQDECTTYLVYSWPGGSATCSEANEPNAYVMVSSVSEGGNLVPYYADIKERNHEECVNCTCNVDPMANIISCLAYSGPRTLWFDWPHWKCEEDS